MDTNPHFPLRRLIELRMEHAGLDNLVDRAARTLPDDQFDVRRLQNRRPALRDRIMQIAAELDSPKPA